MVTKAACIVLIAEFKTTFPTLNLKSTFYLIQTVAVYHSTNSKVQYVLSAKHRKKGTTNKIC